MLDSLVVVGGLTVSVTCYRVTMALLGRAPIAMATDGTSRLINGLIFGSVLIALTFGAETLSRLISGASLGDLIARVRLVRVDGAPLRFAVLLERERYRAFESAPAALDGIRYTPLKQRPADKMAGTTVVRAASVPSVSGARVLAGVIGQLALTQLALALALLLRTAWLLR